MIETCPECGSEMKNGGSPMSAMGEPMYGRGLVKIKTDKTIQKGIDNAW